MDAKYGRLFTQKDVEQVAMAFATTTLRRIRGGDTSPRSEEEISAMVADAIGACEPDLRFPADEPLFLLRGQDELAPDTIGGPATLRHDIDIPTDYVGRCIGRTAVEHAQAAAEAANAMREWQAEHPDRVKTPG